MVAESFLKSMLSEPPGSRVSRASRLDASLNTNCFLFVFFGSFRDNSAEMVGKGIPFANGVVAAHDKQSVLVCALNSREIRKYPLNAKDFGEVSMSMPRKPTRTVCLAATVLPHGVANNISLVLMCADACVCR